MIEDCFSIPDSQCDCLGAKDHDHRAVRFGTPALTNPESQDDLCSTCQTLNLAAIRRVSCPNCFPDQIGLFGSSDPLRSNDRDLGPVRRILDNEGCPACRLVASCILSSGYQITPESAVTLHVMSMHKYPTGTIGLTSACIEVLIQELDTRGTIVGKIVPVGPEVDAKLQSESVFCTSETDLSIMGRLVPSTINVRLLRQWMKHCETSHPACRQTTPISPGFNKKIRLIDVKERRIVDGTLDARYVALSYVWGSQTSPILTKSTLEHLIAPNSLTNKKLSQTIVDAIELVADLGERYLWVDSACIIQDEPIDKQLQLPIMDRIYSGAALVVVAAAGGNADAGLPGRGKRSRTFDQRVETIQPVQLVNIRPDLVYLLRDTVWYSRGWTFQETLLSRRALIFTEHQVYWSCRCDTWCEDQYTPHGDLVTPLNWYSSLFGPRKTSSCGWIQENFVPCETQQYCARVVEYSFRSLKDQGDALWAFVGILKSMRDDFDKGFIWGMPYQILDHALLWRPNCPWHFHRRSATHSAVKLGGQAVEPMRFPSFSWLSVYCGVYYPDTCDDDLVSEVEWHEPMYYDGIERCLRVFDCGHTLVLPPEEAIHNYHDKTSEPGLDEHGTDFGLLQFTAETATLVLRIAPETETTIQKDSQLVQANIHAPSGEVIGTIWAERDKFSHERESEGEFVLLSSYQLDPDDPGYNHRHPGKTTDMVPCKHVAELNIMLINWSRELAYRVSWTRITRDAWSKLSVTKKKIVLA